MIEADTGLEISSLVSSDGSVEVGLREVRLPVPGPDEVIVRIEASPVNPSDLIQMLALADLGTASLGEREGRPLLTAKVHPGMMPSVAMRVGVPQRVGTEGAGTVVRAGSRWQHIVGRTVSLLSDGCFAQYRCMRGDACFVMPEGVTAREAASASGNPLTALGIVETVRQHGGTALIHSAAASSVGRMLIRLCREEGIELVNIVRREAQAEELKQLGAAHVLASEAEGFRAGLADAIAGTGADIAFDAVGGRLTGDILSAMEAAGSRNLSTYDRYGSRTKKHIFVYGALDSGPIRIGRNVGLSWDVSGWLLFSFLDELAADRAEALRDRVRSGLRTTFATDYAAVISLADILQPEILASAAAQASGSKLLINPQIHISS